jgi:restriction endonuclease S subunit
MKKGWETRNLGDLCRIRTGKKDVNEGNPDGEFPFFTCAAEHTFSDNYSFDTEALLIAGNGDVGKVSYYSGKFEAYQRTYVLSDFTEVSPRFLFLILDGKLKDTVSKQKLGNTMPYIKVGMLTDFQLPVPPLAEQQRIVGLLDEAFEGLATAKANAEKNLQNARALFESHLQSVFTQRGQGWVESSIGETCEMYQPKTIGTKDLVPDGPYPVFGANGIIGRYDKFNHQEPQLLVTCRGATCGSVNVSEPKSWVTGNAMVVRPKDHALDLHFLEFVFRGGIDISAAITGSAQPQITRTNLSPLRIRYPQSLTEQRRLAERFQALTAETQGLGRLYERKLAALEALKKSLLHQAFTGEL